eukprot:s1398_g25.t1
MKERLPMDDIDMGHEAILLRVATLRVTLRLALQKLLRAGLRFPSSEIDRLLDKLNNMLGNAGDNVKARLEKCIEHCNRMWVEDSTRQRKSLTDLLFGIEEDDDRVQEKRFPQVVALDDVLTAPLEVLLRDEDDDSLSPANMLRCSCQIVLKQALKTSPRAAVTAGKILEYAYLWVLACRSCKFSKLRFDELLVPFQCKDVEPGYIFQENSKSLDSAKVAEMQNATLYYAEGNHPCADIFTSNMSNALNKVQKMDDVLVKEGLREDLQVSELNGVVLLPNIVSISQEDVGSSHHRHRGKSQKAAWWTRPTACLAAIRLKPKAGEPNQSQGKKERVRKGAARSATTKHFAIKHDKTRAVGCCVIADFGGESEDNERKRNKRGKEDE